MPIKVGFVAKRVGKGFIGWLGGINKIKIFMLLNAIATTVPSDFISFVIWCSKLTKEGDSVNEELWTIW